MRCVGRARRWVRVGRGGLTTGVWARPALSRQGRGALDCGVGEAARQVVRVGRCERTEVLRVRWTGRGRGRAVVAVDAEVDAGGAAAGRRRTRVVWPATGTGRGRTSNRKCEWGAVTTNRAARVRGASQAGGASAR